MTATTACETIPDHNPSSLSAHAGYGTLTGQTIENTHTGERYEVLGLIDVYSGLQLQVRCLGLGEPGKWTGGSIPWGYRQGYHVLA